MLMLKYGVTIDCNAKIALWNGTLESCIIGEQKLLHFIIHGTAKQLFLFKSKVNYLTVASSSEMDSRSLSSSPEKSTISVQLLILSVGICSEYKHE